jgi:hypothetical protein
MEELISRDFKGFDEVVHGDGILTSFIEEYVEIELIIGSIIVAVGVMSGFIGEFQHMFILFNHKVFELLVLF